MYFDINKVIVLITFIVILIAIEIIWQPSIDFVRNKILLWHGRKTRKFIVLYDSRWFE